MQLPHPCGEISAAVTEGMWRPGYPVILPSLPDPEHALRDRDLQLSLWMLYELHYRGFDDVLDEAEWEPELLTARRRLEDVLDGGLEFEFGGLADRLGLVPPAEFPDALFELTETYEGPALAEYVQRRASLEQVREFLLLRSVYHLKEADPHSFAIPRLTGAAKASLVELQYDEYGDGKGERVHQDLYAITLRGAGVDPAYGAYVDLVPAETLAVSNAMSLFGLHRGRRGAAMGHLAAFEATSSVPCRRVAAGIRRVGLGEDVARYFDEHVEADAVHEQLAVRGICAAIVAEHPELQRDVGLGAVACLGLEATAGRQQLAAWQDGRMLVLPPPMPADEPLGVLS